MCNFFRKMCMNWTIWVLIQSHLLPILFSRPNPLSDAPTFPPKSVFKRWPFVDPIFSDKVFIIRKLSKFLSGLNSWFLLILRIQTDWLHGAQWALLIDPCFVTKCLLSASSRSFSQGLNSWFLLFPRIQTDWLQSAHHLQFNDTQGAKNKKKKRRRGGKREEKGRKRKKKKEGGKKKEEGHCNSGGTFKVIKHSEPSSASARDVRTAGEKKYVRQRISNNH